MSYFSPNKIIESLKKNKEHNIYINSAEQLKNLLKVKDFKKTFRFYNKVINTIENAKLIKGNVEEKYKTNTKKAFYQTILKLIDAFKMPMTQNARKKYKQQFEETKTKSYLEGSEKQKEETILNFNDYLKKVKEKYGPISKEYIIASLYNIYGFRDNLQLIIKRAMPEEPNEMDKVHDNNYIIVNKNPEIIIILNKYKTNKKYGTEKIKINKELSNIIKDYINKNNLKEGEYIFGNQNLSKFISNFNKKLNLDITINKLRQMKASSYFKDDKKPNAKERVEIANIMKHNPQTTEKYIRKVV